MARKHLSLKEMADTLRVDPRYVGQKVDAALLTVGTLFRAYPKQVLRMLDDQATELDQAEAAEDQRFSEELPLREAMLDGRANRSETMTARGRFR